MVNSEISSELGVGTERTALEGLNILDAKGERANAMDNQRGTQHDVITLITSGHAWPMPIPAVTSHGEGVPFAVTGTTGMGNSP